METWHKITASFVDVIGDENNKEKNIRSHKVGPGENVRDIKEA